MKLSKLIPIPHHWRVLIDGEVVKTGLTEGEVSAVFENAAECAHNTWVLEHRTQGKWFKLDCGYHPGKDIAILEGMGIPLPGKPLPEKPTI